MNLLDVVLALTVVLLLMSTLASIMYAGSEKNIQKRAAEELQYVAKAAEHYAHRHHETLLPVVTATTGRRITVQDLINDNFLPQGAATQNVWGQDYGIYFRRVEATVPDGKGGTIDDHSLRVIVLTEGGYRGNNERVFNNRTVPGTLPFMPSGGGYISSGDIPSQPANSLIGTGWTLVLASVGVPSPGPGHMGVVSTFNSPSMTHDYLYRVDVGREELNTMETELHMNDYAILGTKEVEFIPHTMDEMQDFCLANQEESRVFQLEDNGLYICRQGHVVGAPSETHEILDTGNALAIKDVRLVSHGELISKPVCAPHTNSEPEIEKNGTSASPATA